MRDFHFGKSTSGGSLSLASLGFAGFFFLKYLDGNDWRLIMNEGTVLL